MSKRNSHAAKAARRAVRDKIHAQAAADTAAGLPSADIHDLGELTALAMRGESLPCGCDAHELLHEFLPLPDPGPYPGR